MREQEQRQISVFVPGKPVSWARTRVSRGGIFFTPQKQRIYKLSVSSHFMRKVRSPMEGPVVCVIRVQLLRPKSNKTLLPTTRNTSDVDNWAKMILDAGNGYLWKDDCQVVSLEVSKVWVTDAEGEGVLVQVTELTADDIVEAIEEISAEIQ
jgi:Holliday junction resolvase RusA-like endonuclease